MAACGTTPDYEQTQTFTPPKAKEIIRRAFEQQTPGLRLIDVEVSQEAIALRYHGGHRERAYTIHYEDITELLVRHRKRYAVIIFDALQSGTDYRKLEFESKHSTFKFMDAINSLW